MYRNQRLISRKYKGDMCFLDGYSDYVEVKKVNFEDVTMNVRLDSASSEDDLVIESGEIVDVVLLK